MATKLSLFNGALRILKDRKLTQAEVTNNSREPARLLNGIWDNGGIRACLEAGQWKFATRTVMLDASPSVEPDFGFQYAFDKPTDCVRIVGVWSDEMLRTPHRQYREEAGYWYGSLETMYVSYVSDDEQYGNDFSLWPQSFIKFAEAHFASEVAGPLTEEGMAIIKVRDFYLDEANSKDAMSDPSKRLPVGSWVRSRLAGYGRDGQPR
jgi:hypothetical protein